MSTWIDLEQITPLHEPRNRRLVKELTEDMMENGWKGRPLLVIERESDFLAWTGSHRLAAAQRAALTTVPCHVVPESELLRRGFHPERGHVMDYERLKIVRAVGDEAAIRIMWQEGRPI